MSSDPRTEAIADSLRALAAKLAAPANRRAPLTATLAEISGLPFLHPDLFDQPQEPPDLPPRLNGGCSGSW